MSGVDTKAPPKPICIVGCYVLDLYCANKCDPLNRRTQYTGANQWECFADARKSGWVLGGGDLAYCPKCANGTKRKKTVKV